MPIAYFLRFQIYLVKFYLIRLTKYPKICKIGTRLKFARKENNIIEYKQDLLTKKQKITLASIVQVGDATYHDLAEAESPMFGHQYFTDVKGRIHTKLVQMQCEIESQDEKFPFEFSERNFCYGHILSFTIS